MPRNVDRKSSYPHYGDNRVDNAYNYPHIGDNSVDSLGTIRRPYQIDLHQSRQSAMCNNPSGTHAYTACPAAGHLQNAHHHHVPRMTAITFGIIDAGVRNSESDGRLLRRAQGMGRDSCASSAARLDPARFNQHCCHPAHRSAQLQPTPASFTTALSVWPV